MYFSNIIWRTLKLFTWDKNSCGIIFPWDFSSFYGAHFRPILICQNKVVWYLIARKKLNACTSHANLALRHKVTILRVFWSSFATFWMLFKLCWEIKFLLREKILYFNGFTNTIRIINSVVTVVEFLSVSSKFL